MGVRAAAWCHRSLSESEASAVLGAFLHDRLRAGPKAHGVLEGLHVRFTEKSPALKGNRVPWEAAARARVTEVCTKGEHL